MFKKILGLAICVSAIVSSVIPAYASKDTEWKTEVLMGLGLYQENLVTYDGFINSLAGFLYENPAEFGDAETIARNSGMIDFSDAYSGNSALSVADACKFAVITLGYKPVMGDDGNYMKKASEIGIADGILANGNDRLKQNVAVDILYDMIDANPLVKTYGGIKGQDYVVARNETLLHINRDIYVIKGIVTGTEITSIYGPEYVAGKDSIVIDEYSYYAGEKRYDSLLGKNVIAYIQKSDIYNDTVLYVAENEDLNESVIIDSGDIIDIGESISDITYYKSDDRTKTVKIAVSPRVIYNGMFQEEYSEADFMRGELELIDNNGDRVYDVIKVLAYQTMVVEAIDSREMIIRNRYRNSGLDDINLNNLKDDDIIYRIYDSTGAEVGFPAIKTDDVLSVLRSRNGKIIDVYISGNGEVNGRVLGIDNLENTIDIEGEIYERSIDFGNFLTYTSKTIEVGKTYTFAIDYFGRIAYLKEDITSDYKVLVKIIYDDFDDKYYASYMDMNGDWYKTLISEKVRFDGVKPGDYYTKMENLREGNDTIVLPQVVLFKLNAQNEIISIDTAVVTTDSDFNKGVASNYQYCGHDRFFHNGTKLVYLENNAKVVVIPSENKKENWRITSADTIFKNEHSYDIEYFNLDEYMFTDLITVAETTELTLPPDDAPLFVVTGTKLTMVGDETRPMIKGSVDGFMNLSFIGKENNTFDVNGRKVKPGDVISFILDQKGMISSIVYKLNLIDDDFMTRPKEGIYTRNSIHSGKVADIDYENGKIMLDRGDPVPDRGKKITIPFRVNPNMQVTVYYSDNRCESKPLSAINRSTDKVLIRTSYGVVKEIICVKN